MKVLTPYIAVAVGLAGTGAAVNASAKYDGALAHNKPHYVGHGATPGTEPGDRFLTYDGLPSDGKVKQSNRDWPITMIWRKSATKEKVRLWLGFNQTPPGRGEPREGEEIEERYVDAHATGKHRRVTSKGRKSECGTSGANNHRNVHIRFYGQLDKTTAPDSTYLYDPTSKGWGFFIVTSTHFDKFEETDPAKELLNNGNPNPCYVSKRNRAKKWGGRSETAARWIEQQYVDPPSGDPSNHWGALRCDQYPTDNLEGQPAPEGAPVPKCGNPGGQNTTGLAEPSAMGNTETGTNDSKHFWQNDGMATVIEVNTQ